MQRNLFPQLARATCEGRTLQLEKKSRAIKRDQSHSSTAALKKQQLKATHATGEHQTQGGWRDGVFVPAMLSAIALWSAFAPLNWSLVAWLAPMGWLLVIERKRPVGRGGYFVLWLSGCCFWLLILQGIRLAFWPLYFGWIALSLYLAVYIPLFVGATRVLRFRARMPLVVAAPMIWVGLELIRSYFLTGFAANTLAHSQAHWPLVIQLADQVGTGGISFIMLTVSAAVLQVTMFYCGKSSARSVMGSAATAIVMLLILLGYGWWKLAEADQLTAAREPVLRALLIQENTPTIFEYNPERNSLAWTRYLNLTREAVAQHGAVDLVVWPESTFTGNEPYFEAKLTNGVPKELASEGVTEEYLLDVVGDFERRFNFRVSRLLEAAGVVPDSDRDGFVAPKVTVIDSTANGFPYLLVGCDVGVYTSAGLERYNSALFLRPNGELAGRYAKMHRVMFGEYIPLGPLLKWLGDSFGLSGIQAGQTVESFALSRDGASESVRIAPNICFESTVPQLIAKQVRELATRGESPDVLVNLTNDSWFRGSSVLDHHLACTILSAVETRRPVLVAANTGISAHIDGAGRVVEATDRLEAAAILAEVRRDGRRGLVQAFGYPLAWGCGLGCLATWIFVLFDLVRRRGGQAS